MNKKALFGISIFTIILALAIVAGLGYAYIKFSSNDLSVSAGNVVFKVGYDESLETQEAEEVVSDEIEIQNKTPINASNETIEYQTQNVTNVTYQNLSN